MIALWRGWLPSVIGVIPYVGLNFSVYETLKDVVLKHYGESVQLVHSIIQSQYHKSSQFSLEANADSASWVFAVVVESQHGVMSQHAYMKRSLSDMSLTHVPQYGSVGSKRVSWWLVTHSSKTQLLPSCHWLGPPSSLSSCCLSL